jgi:NADH-quinone oxidoreductase subunit G
LQNRGAMQQIGTFNEDVLHFDGYGPVGAAAEDESGGAFSSYYSGNTIQICPVGALTSASYRFRSRPFDLVSSPGVSEHDSSGSAIRTDHRRGKILRRLADNDPVVNEDWITDKDRFAFTWQNQADRITQPLLRKDGALVEVSWPEALAAAAAGLNAAIGKSGDARADKKAKGVGVLPGGRVTMEDAYAYSKFARLVLDTNDVDARTRYSSDEEQSFLGANVAGTGLGVTFAELEKAPTVLLVGFEPEDEGGVVFLRLKKSVGRQKVFTVASHLSRGAEKLRATLLPAVPGYEASVVSSLKGAKAAYKDLREPGSIIVVGERAAASPGALTAVDALAKRAKAKVAWIPRRAGERGAVEAGALPGLLPGGRDVASTPARDAVAKAWGASPLPRTKGRDADAVIAAASAKALDGLVIGGVDDTDLTDDLLKAINTAKFTVSIEVRRTAVAEAADVVLPVAPPSEKSGTYVNWEGRLRAFGTAIHTDAMSDHRVLDLLARQMGVDLGTATVDAVNAEIASLGAASAADRPKGPAEPSPAAPKGPVGTEGELVLSTWHQLVDEGALQEGEPYLAGTGRIAVARVSPATAKSLGLHGVVTVTGKRRGSIDVPLAITAGMVDDVVWLPTKSPGSWVAQQLGVQPGETVVVKGMAS